ncbi:MAG: major capsid protein [Microviridae sp.]|nr:MAG: major capsid protein [Microviridae sp.]
MAKYFNQPEKMNSSARFSQAPQAEIERSKFDRSHGVKTTFNAGQLIPVYLDEVLPGDTFTMHSTGFCRMATLLKPIMDNLYLDTHYFFVPNRLVWDNWQRFMGEQDNPTDNPGDYSVPKTPFNLANGGGTLADYFGVPVGQTSSQHQISALPFRAYTLIWNEWYRDENIQDSLVFSKGDGPDAWGATMPAYRNKRKDYFTSALPWPQKGDSIFIPLGTSAPVVGDPNQAIQIAASASNNTPRTMILGPDANTSGQGNLGYGGALVTGNLIAFLADQDSGMIADLTQATAITINDLRTAFQIQKLLERNARGGTRYIELVLAHFGVSSPDLRAIRPVYLGGGSTPISVNPVAATANVIDETIQGDLSAYATGVQNAGFSHSFTEHGYVMGIVSVRSDLTYQNGIERHWKRTTRYDYYWPATAHLGEQSIRNWELQCVGDDLVDNEVFGYQERHAEYRYKPSRITGKFRSSDPTSLDFWHTAQDFADQPVPLNSYFLADLPAVQRVVAVPSEPHFLLDMWFSLQCARPMPVYAVPGLVDHF